MRSQLVIAAMLAVVVVLPLRSQSIAGARAGLAAPTPLRLTDPRDAPLSRFVGAAPLSSGDESSDRWAKGMMAGALVGLIVGLLINVNQLQNGGSHSAILPAVGVGALLGLMIGTG